LVFGSGFCALIYQTVWTRQLRLVFGASTAASSAVVAIFIAGLGFGGLWFGRRVERSNNPLRYYALLELAIGALSALTPWLLDAVRVLYGWSGGSPRLGGVGSNALRLALASLVLLPPTWLMGGTLPALARAIEAESDRSRRAVAIVYALNTLGAVLGCGLSSFVLLEALGNRASLHLACLVNVSVGAFAYVAARRLRPLPPSATEPSAAGSAQQLTAAEVAPVWFAYASAAVVGFAFFLMELVWYRVLGPLLGGSVFSFGVILCVALFGIGTGSALYAAVSSTRPRLLAGFGLSCAAEAVCIALPFALGDRLALSALFLQPFAARGFSGSVLGWFSIALCVVFPAALLSGLQFPLLIALLGSGRAAVGRHVGSIYAANTSGAIAGALAGGFGLLPALGALGCWRAVSVLLAGWSLVAAALAFRQRRPSVRALAEAAGVLLLSAASLALVRADGPSAVFRHSPIGVGRVPLSQFDGPNAITAFLTQERRSVDWQTDGIESAVAITHYDGVSFIVNGKSDGSALTDAATQVMGGLLGAALLPHVQKALVIGLGTGSTAGWLASLPEIERVDVAEIEPAISQVARRCAAVNQDALKNKKLHVIRGDARELLSVLRDDYDVIFSEPSNPYRAGVASMYAQEFYAAVQRRLAPNGLFIQWLQAYDVDARSVATIYTTLASVFPHVETWNGLREDLLLVASRKELVHDVAALRARIAEEPFARALRLAWYTDSLEGFLAHYLADDAFTRVVAAGTAPLNTDDASPVEFGFARTARGGARFSSLSIFAAAQAREAERPRLRGGEVDWAHIDYEGEAFALVMGSATSPERLSPAYLNRFSMLSKWVSADFPAALELWSLMKSDGTGVAPTRIERLARAEMLAYDGSIESEREIDRLLRDRPTEATALHAVYLLRHGQAKAGSEMLRAALQRYRGDPWPHPLAMLRALSNLQIGDPIDRAFVPRWLEALAHPFALRVNESARDRTRLRLAYALGPAHPACVQVFESFEPYPPWSEDMLQFRSACYEAHAHALRDQAARDLQQFRRNAPVDFESLLPH
jgi:spermidine synthase